MSQRTYLHFPKNITTFGLNYTKEIGDFCSTYNFLFLFLRCIYYLNKVLLLFNVYILNINKNI